jgi:hypothetical protein
VLLILGCWLGYSLNWIRQRHEILSANKPKGTRPAIAAIESTELAPAFLHLFGERGYPVIYRVNPENDFDIERITKLFPEACIQTQWLCRQATK